MSMLLMCWHSYSLAQYFKGPSFLKVSQTARPWFHMKQCYFGTLMVRSQCTLDCHSPGFITSVSAITGHICGSYCFNLNFLNQFQCNNLLPFKNTTMCFLALISCMKVEEYKTILCYYLLWFYWAYRFSTDVFLTYCPCFLQTI